MKRKPQAEFLTDLVRTDKGEKEKPGREMMEKVYDK